MNRTNMLIIKKIQMVGISSMIVSDDFENISLIKRHQLIYDALSSMIKIEIHAILLKQ